MGLTGEQCPDGGASLDSLSVAASGDRRENKWEGKAMDVLSTTGYQRRPPHLIAEYKGFFASEGLEVRFHETTYAPDHNRGMAEGRWDFTLSSADTMIARTTTDGVDYLLFMQAEEGLSAYLIGQPEIASIEQLRGELLAGDPGDSNLDLIRKKILRRHGMDDDQYEIEIIGSSPKRLEAFLNGRVAGAMLTPPASDKALGAGGVLLANAEDYVPGWPLTCGWTLRRWLLEHHDLTVRFIRAWAAATDWLLAPQNRAETLDLIIAKEGLNRNSAEQAYRKVVPRARINPAALNTVIELRKEMGVYKPPYDSPERFYDSSYWQEAMKLPV
jgi:ABC-type nitrate/sulfonate/bicarbonate transport system substrate-binding protein